MKQAKITTRQGKGITLIALVVTIVILIILATISVNLVLNGGLVNRTQSGKEMHELERERERLELVKVDVASNTNHIGKVTVDTYVEELVNQGITVEDEIMDNGNGSKTVITDTGYSVLIEPVGENDVKITIEGKAGQLPPRIRQVNVDVELDSIKVKVEAIRADKYNYEYKEADKIENETWITVKGEESSVIITEIDTNKDYIIRVKAINEHGEVTKEVNSGGEEESIANAPRLSDGMIPVKWNGINWEKTTESDKDWYDYSSSSKKWANVVLGDSIFKEAEGKEVLDETKNYSMLVWIPRYAYQIRSMYHQAGDTRTAGKINLVFINTQNINSVTGTKYTRDSAEQYPEATIGGRMKEYVVHPAFDFGGNKLSGFWVGKFESSNIDKEQSYNGTDKTMMVKALVKAWRGIYISNAFDVCLEMNKKGNVYKLPTSDSIVDPHMMKNDEWGAVAYLGKSKYGNEIVYTNNSSGITGKCGPSIDSTTGSEPFDYNTERGQKASINGNITGIYDMRGGCDEFVAAYLNNGHKNLKRIWCKYNREYK